MALSALPSTPIRNTTPTAISPNDPFSTPSPGTWRHPAMNEIRRRQNATNFDERNIKKIALNGLALLGTFYVSNYIHSSILFLSAALGHFPLFPTLSQWLVRLLLSINIVFAIRPLWLPKDQVTDIPLTPSQRAVLGLDPVLTPSSSPGTQYITPPRYRKSSTSRNGTPAVGGNRSASGSYSSSPLSGRNYSTAATPGSASSLTPGKLRTGDSPFSPPVASPYFQKAVGLSFGTSRERDTSRRHSLGSPSMFGQSTAGSSVFELGAPGTPSPIRGPGLKGTNGGRKSPSVGLTYKWLYEKSRDSGDGVDVY